MTTPPGANVDTTGVVGNSGPLPVGTQYGSGGTKDTSDTGAGAYASETPRPNPPGLSGTLDTEGVYGPNKPENFTPVSTLLSGTRDTLEGFAGNQSAPVYRAPSTGVSASIKDTTNAYGFTSAVPTDNYPWIMGGTTETGSFGAPGGSISSTNDVLTIHSSTPAVSTKKGVIGAANTLTVVNYGRIIAVTDEGGHTIDQTTPFTATNSGVITSPAGVVVKKGSTVLTQGTDYTITGTGSGATANYSILRVAASPNVANSDAVTISYSYGNAAYFTPVPLTLTTDYTVTFAGSSGGRTFSLLRNGASSNVANGDSVAVNYTFGDATYWGTHDPAAVPPAPTIGTAVTGDRKAKVVWTNPSLAATDNIDGYIIQTDTGGSRYVPGGLLSFFFETLSPGIEYKFRVAAFNERGQGPYSAWSNAVTPLNFDEVPGVGLDPKNTINYIYNADGTTVPGTGLGV